MSTDLATWSYRASTMVNETREVKVARVRLNAHGYTRRGSYYGVGEPLFYVHTDQETFQIRASDYQTARQLCKAWFPLAKIDR
jgi:hypothetical protein